MSKIEIGERNLNCYYTLEDNKFAPAEEDQESLCLYFFAIKKKRTHMDVGFMYSEIENNNFYDHRRTSLLFRRISSIVNFLRIKSP